MSEEEEIFAEETFVVALANWENDKRKNLEAQGVIFINGEITTNLVGSVSRAILNYIYCANNEPKRLVVFINSEGGELWGGWMLYDLLKLASRKGIKVITVAVGKVQSAATLPFLAGDKRLTSRNAVFTIHEASSWLVGKTSEQKDYLRFLTERENAYIDLVVQETHISRRQLKANAYRKDWNFSAQEAVKLGFAHGFAEDLLLSE